MREGDKVSEIVWKDPPTQDNRYVWVDVLAPLVDHPGRWAIVRTTKTSAVARSTVDNLNRGTLRPPPGRWEFRASGCEVFARYLGPDTNGTNP